MSSLEMVTFIGGIGAFVFAFLAWRKSDNESSGRLIIIETKLENVLENLRCVINKLDDYELRLDKLENRVTTTEEQIKSCFKVIYKEIENREKGETK